MKRSVLAAAAAVALFATAAVASQFDPYGTVGNGAVRSALGLSKAQLKTMAQAHAFVFDYETNAQYQITCTKAHERVSLEQTRRTVQRLSYEIDWTTKNNKNTGDVNNFLLQGPMGEPDTTTDGGCPTGWDMEGEGELIQELGGSKLYVNGVRL
jgi:opacity protein-like surface antigen